MAYKPTLSDLPEFKPTLSDLPEEKSSFRNDHPFISGLADVAGGLQSGIGQGFADILNIPHALYGKIPSVGNSQPSPMFMGVADPESALYNIPKNITEFLPAAAGSEFAAAKALPKASNFLKSILTGAGSGFGGTEGSLSDRAENAAVGAALVPALSAVKTAGPLARRLYESGTANQKGAVNTLMNALNPKIMEDTASNYYNELSGGLDRNELNSKTAAHVMQNYNTQKDIGTKLYENLLEKGKQNGYSDKIPTRDGKVIVSTNQLDTPKHISLSTETRENLARIRYPEHPNFKGKSAISSPTDSLKKALNVFRDSPSLKNAQELQSTLGHEWGSLNANVSRDPAQNEAKYIYGKTRNAILNDIDKTFTKNGDVDLKDMFKTARTHWNDNVIPYQKAPQIKTLIYKGDYPVNMLKTLEKDDSKGRFDTIRKHINESENSTIQSRNILSQALSDGITGERGAKITNPENLQSAYNKIPDVIKSLTPDNAKSELKNLIDKEEHYNKVREQLKGGAKMAGIGGGVAGGGYLIHLLRQIL